jgi:hypothetical protein
VDVLIGVGVVDVWVAEGSQAANDSTQATSADENMVNLTRDLTVGIVTTSNVAVKRAISPIDCHSIGFS